MEKAVISPAFADVRPKSTAGWFRGPKGGEGKITEIVGLRYLNTSEVTTMRGMFSTTQSLTSIDLSGFDTSNVTDMEDMFFRCSGLTTLDLSKFNTSNVTQMTDMFAFCTGLTALDLSSFNTANVTTMYLMFYGCTGLTELNLASFDTSNVTDMGSMFEDCTNLKTIYCNDTWNADESYHMFSDCTSLVGAVAFDSSKTDVSMANPATGYFTAETMPDITGDYTWKYQTASTVDTDATGVSGTGDVNISLGEDGNYVITGMDSYELKATLKRCPGGLYLMIPDQTVMTHAIAGDIDFCGVYYDAATGWTVSDVVWGKVMDDGTIQFDDSQWIVTMVKSGDFAGNYMGNKYMPASILTPKTGPLPYVLWTEGDKTLHFVYTEDNITVGSDYNGQTVTNLWKGEQLYEYRRNEDGEYVIGWSDKAKETEKIVIDESFKDFRPVNTMLWFGYALKVKEIEGLSNLNTSEVENMNGMFWYCSSLTSLDISSFDTSKVETMTGMFYFCSSLTSLDLSSFDTSKVEKMTGMFWCCSSLTSLDLSSFDTSKVKNTEGMFFRCEGLTSLDLSSFDTTNLCDIAEMFAMCSNLKTLDLSNFNINVDEGEAVFYRCTSLETIYCNYVWNYPEEQEIVFNNCVNLVGGAGTKYDPSHVGSGYTRPDGGDEAPGYFTKKPDHQKGDVNEDGEVNINDVVAIINQMAGTATWRYANVNEDAEGTVDINDVVAVINIMAGK